MNEKIEKKPVFLSPFKRFCMTIGELPTSYLETMTYYEMLLWFTKYLGETVIPTINNNAEAVDEMQKLFVELQNYVNTYFDDLDIQTEVNNKLDEMSESGELADIIAQYLEVASVLGYDTKTNLKNAENLANGSITRTLGKNRYNDGNGSFYKIRTITSSDVIDDDNILSLTNYNTLIAEKLPCNRLKIYNITASNTQAEILDMINDPEPKILNFETATYTFTEPWYLNNHTYIDLNNSTIFFDFIGDYDETIGIYGYKLTDTFTEYNGNEISIKNGIIKKGSIALMHNKNSIFENIKFIETYCPHVIQLASCKDVTIKNCEFNGTRYQSTEENYVSNEIINIDKNIYTAQPYLDENSVMYDETPNDGIDIINNTFNSGNLINFQTYVCIGSHADISSEEIYSKNINIVNNKFNYSYYSCLQFVGLNNVKILNNYYDGTGARQKITFILTRRYNQNVEIRNNVCENICEFVHSGSVTQLLFNKDFIISNNEIDSLTYDNVDATISLRNFKDTLIENNYIKCTKTGIRLWAYDTVNLSENITIINNTIDSATTNESLLKAYGDSNTKIIGNNFIGLNSTVHCLAFNSDSVNHIIQNNKYNNPLMFMEAQYVNRSNSNNTALYQLSDVMSTNSVSGNTPLGTLSNFKGFELLVGSGATTQVIKLRPFLHNGVFMDSRTMVAPSVSQTPSLDYVSFTTDTTNNTYSYTSTNTPLRKVYGID